MGIDWGEDRMTRRPQPHKVDDTDDTRTFPYGGFRHQGGGAQSPNTPNTPPAFTPGESAFHEAANVAGDYVCITCEDVDLNTRSNLHDGSGLAHTGYNAREQVTDGTKGPSTDPPGAEIGVRGSRGGPALRATDVVQVPGARIHDASVDPDDDGD